MLKVAPLLVGMAIFGLAIGLPLAWAVSQFHQSSQTHEQQSARASGHNSQAGPNATERNKAEATPKQAQHQKEHDWWGPEALLVYVTVPLTIFTGLLFRSTRILARDSRKAAADNLTLAYPPRIKVGTIHFWEKGKGAMFQKNRVPTLRPGLTIEGGILATNYGREVATVISSDCIFFWTKDPLPSHRPFFGDRRVNQIFLNTLGKDDEWFTPVAEMPPGYNAGWIIEKTIDGEGDTLYVLGFIVFNDRLGTRRKTIFGRRYDPAEDRFVAVDNPDYEAEE